VTSETIVPRRFKLSGADSALDEREQRDSAVRHSWIIEFGTSTQALVMRPGDVARSDDKDETLLEAIEHGVHMTFTSARGMKARPPLSLDHRS
jgi:hypothetical protein